MTIEQYMDVLKMLTRWRQHECGSVFTGSDLLLFFTLLDKVLLYNLYYFLIYFFK